MSNWEAVISHLPGASAHIFQTKLWAENKAQTGWEPNCLVWFPEAGHYAMSKSQPGQGQPSAAALVLHRRIRVAGLSARLGVCYVPKGPLLDWSNAALRQKVLSDLAAYARTQGAIFIKIDPDVPISTGYPAQDDYQPDPHWDQIRRELVQHGWHASKEQIQFKNTIVIDLAPTEDELLARMKQKTRYNIRLAERKGVLIRTGTLDDLPLLYQMYAETSVRDGFVIRSKSYYQSTWRAFIEAEKAEALIAEVEGQAVAAVIVFRFAGKAWYIYGMSREAHREKMPNHLLQWEAIRRAKAAGCSTYDLWGAPDELVENDPLWGVYRFKEGLGGKVLCTMGAWDLPTRPLFFKLYTETIPHLLETMRRRGKEKTLQEVRQ
jgi:lipid II:glycine glycyltransferase (peptidoglycan interpeptide bridge formation enzyme)